MTFVKEFVLFCMRLYDVERHTCIYIYIYVLQQQKQHVRFKWFRAAKKGVRPRRPGRLGMGLSRH